MTTEEMLFKQYGTSLLDMDQLAKLLGFKDRKPLLNAISAGRCACPTKKIGKKRFALVADVAKFLESAEKGAAA